MALLKPKSRARGASSKQPTRSRRFDGDKLVPVVVLLLLSVVGAGLYQGMMVLLSQPVTRVLVNGDFHHVDQQAIVDQVQPLLADGFVRVDLASIRQQLLQHPWIFDVTLSRRWPGQIQIAVTEQIAIARWGDSAYLNHRGELFEPSSGLNAAATLPQLYGPDDSTAQVMNHFRELGKALSQANIRLDRLILNDRGNWSARLDSAVDVTGVDVDVEAARVDIVLGAGEVMEKMRRFLWAYQQGLAANFSQIKTIDMRYSNGFAVAWKATDKQG